MRQVLGVVGAVVGAYFGNPMLGYAIGSAIGGAVDPEVIKGPSLGDISTQTSSEGGPRPIVWALSAPMTGNVIASGEPRIVRKRTRQGKGGPKVETEQVFRTYAMGVCEGPITRFVRVWRNNTLVYDVSEHPALTAEDNAEFLKFATFYTGTWTQTANTALEKEFGVGTTPSHRGTAYMVMADEDLTDLRGAIPQWVFQVERCEGFFLTSRPYPLEAEDAIGLLWAEPRDSYVWTPPDEAVATEFITLGGTLGAILQQYDNGVPEAIETEFATVDGELDVALLSYDDGAPEAVATSFAAIDGELEDKLKAYENYPPEAIDTNFAVIDGSLA